MAFFHWESFWVRECVKICNNQLTEKKEKKPEYFSTREQKTLNGERP